MKIQKDHLIFCFKVLETYLKEKWVLEFPTDLEDLTNPIFVTWYKEKELAEREEKVKRMYDELVNEWKEADRSR